LINYSRIIEVLSNENDTKSNTIYIISILMITLAALFLRIRGIDIQGYWHDEFYTLANLVGFDLYLFPGSDLSSTAAILPAESHIAPLYENNFWPNIWRTILHEGPLPPLYTFLLKIWVELTSYSLYSTRLFSVVASTLSIPIMYLAALRLGGQKVALLASAFLATSPFQVYFSVEARNYSLLTLFSVVSTLVAVKLRETDKLRTSHWVFWAVAVFATWSTHYYGIIYCFFLLILYVLPGRRVKSRSDLVYTLVFSSIPFLIFLFWLPILYLQVKVHGDGHWTQGALGVLPSLGQAGFALAELLGGPHIINGLQVKIEGVEYIFVGLFLLTFFFKIAVNPRTPIMSPSRCLLFVILAHMIFVYLLDLVINQNTTSVVRYSICLIIPMYLILGMVAAKMNGFGAILAVGLLLYSTNTSILIGDAERAPKQMLRQVSSYINENYEPGDLVVVTPNGPSMIGLAYYLDQRTMLTAVPAASLSDLVNAPGRPLGLRIWSVQQRLGVDVESWAEPTTPKAKSVIRFVGVDLAEY
jgi:uncharacterized membrane protein